MTQMGEQEAPQWLLRVVMLDFAVKRKYIAENPAAQVKHFNELRERPTRKMLTLDEERRILD